MIRVDVEPEGATRNWLPWPSRPCPFRGGRRRSGPLHLAPARAEVADGRGHMTRRSGRSTGGRPCSTGGARTVVEVRTLARSGSPARRLSELLVWLDEMRPSGGRDQFFSRPPGRGARDARSLRRGARDPRRTARGADRSRRVITLADLTRASPSRSSSWPAIRPPRSSSEQKDAGCTRSRARRSWRSRPGLGASALRARAGSRRQRPGPTARRSSVRATTGTQCSGGGEGEGARASRRARRGGASRPRGGSDLDATDMLNVQGGAYADLAEVLALAGKPRRSSRGARTGARALRAEGERRHGGTRPRTAGGAATLRNGRGTA